ncbi:MAG: metalloregulator ArsR/SmtB family transcription factor [Anaerococcus sp.]|uniref:ArsR/SmtB family transcription factor n=1 Tax=Anaerococcus senegalensis TaxID=1288120 RepID=UPI00058DC70A|nr:metalloregulator ArsR/SmtB family transcription factor [Anaerococcus senegalensis]MDU4715696.1 metalloregulator ArsR/SmtB family transcription factor [Anaerococcus sp.]
MITIKDEEILFDLADLFKVFGDSTRLRIMNVLFSGPTCVCEIAEVLDMSQSSISHQLKRLKDNNLVSSKRSGKSIYYELADDHVKTIFKTGLEHIKE